MIINSAKKNQFSLPLKTSKNCPIELLYLDNTNPRLQTGLDNSSDSEDALISTLADIAALDELITSICTNGYLNLEPMIVIGDDDQGPFKVLEGNRRLATIKLIRNPNLAEKLRIKVPSNISSTIIQSTSEVLCYRVETEDDARAFIGFKHINGAQRWDAYAKAKYVTEWYKKGAGKIKISSIADCLGDNNDTLRTYIYSLLILEQAEAANLWTIRDRANPGRFAFSHISTAIGRTEYQEHLGLGSWSDTPPLKPIAKDKLANLGEILSFIYGSKSSDQPALVKSQNPDLKDLGLAIASSEAFHDAIITANLKLRRAIELIIKYDGKDKAINSIVEEVFERADTLHTMNMKKKGYVSAA
jgi:ParB-like nuclease domain